jgi:hypothetical protein
VIKKSILQRQTRRMLKQGKAVLETAQFGNPTRQRAERGISSLMRRVTVKLMFPNLKI